MVALQHTVVWILHKLAVKTIVEVKTSHDLNAAEEEIPDNMLAYQAHRSRVVLSVHRRISEGRQHYLQDQSKQPS
jgi:hypothetical protein